MIKYGPKPTVTPIMTTAPYVSTTSITDTTTALTTISTTTPTRVSSKKRSENHNMLYLTGRLPPGGTKHGPINRAYSKDILSELLKLPITREELSPN